MKHQPWLFILLAGIFVGCASSNMESLKVEPIYFQAADLNITLIYIPQKELERLHGSNKAYLRVNPYVDFPAYMTRKRFLVFNFKASSATSTINFALKESRLDILGISGDAKSQNYLTKIWEIHTGEEGRERMRYTMNKTLLPREFTVSPDNPVEGYLVFGENYPPEGGEALIKFSVSSGDGSVGFLEIPFNLNLHKASATKENTGIFSSES